MRELGFQGSGFNFKKLEGNYIYTILIAEYGKTQVDSKQGSGLKSILIKSLEVIVVFI